MSIDRKEFYAKVDVWAIERDFWKSDANDWEDILQPLVDKGFSFDEACDIVDSIISLVKSEYGE